MERWVNQGVVADEYGGGARLVPAFDSRLAVRFGVSVTFDTEEMVSTGRRADSL
jgi:hypothetical protein